MPTTLLQATVGAGKTEAALARLSQVISDPHRPFAKAWVLLATKRQEVAFRQRLIDLQDGRAIYFNAEFFNFYDLNARILNLAGQPPRRINESARLGLLRKILYDLKRDNRLSTFAPIVHTSGFLRVVGDLIYELKQNIVYPETYLGAAQTAKDHELALIYDTYQRLMQNYDFVDREGEGWLALEAVQNNDTLVTDVDLLLVDGYDQFTPVQTSLLSHLSQQAHEVIITLTKAPDEDEREKPVVGRRFAEARENLKKQHEKIGASYSVINEDEPKITKNSDLMILAQNIFSDKAPVETSGGIKLIEAPEPLQEVAAILREIKRLLINGIRPDDILIALRDWARYHTYIEMYMRLYDLPLMLHYGEPLINNPAVTVLLNVLSLPSKDPNSVTSFRRRDLLDVLRSPYVQVPGITDEMVDVLDKISQERQVLGGYDNWLKAIDSASEDFIDEDGNEHPAIIEFGLGMQLSTDLETFFDNITAPESGTHLGYIEWLEDLIGADTVEDPDDQAEDSPEFADIAIQPHDAYTLSMPQCIRAISEQADTERIINRDASALNQFKDLLRGILTTQEFLRSSLKDQTVKVSWEDFFADIQIAVKNTKPVQRNPIRSGRVLVTTATEARGLPHEHMFILGLSEGIFPAELPEDPIYLDYERQYLNKNGVTLQTQAERADDDGIFYELISQARQTLTLSRPHVRDGKYWVESHLWRMTRAVFSNLEVQHIGIGQVTPPDDVASLDEAVVALADGLSDVQRKQSIVPLYQWLTQTHGAYWQHIEQGYEIERDRMSDKPHNAFTGQIVKNDLIEVIAERLDNSYTWSASRLNSYGQCAYRFFAGYMLNLEELKPPQEGMDAMQMGSLNHRILEKTYGAIQEESLTIEPENQEFALEILAEEAEKVFRTAPENYKFRPSALWREEQKVIARRLQQLVALDFSDESPLRQFGEERRPYSLELEFGFGYEELRIPIEGGSIKVRGIIDRVDWVDGKLVVVDYKTGSSKISTSQTEDGRNFQMMIYLLALEQKLKQGQHFDIAGGFFWHIRNQTNSGKMTFTDTISDDETVQTGQTHIANYLHKMRLGDFTVQPTKPTNNRCTSYCEFYQLCRLSNTYQYKKDV